MPTQEDAEINALNAKMFVEKIQRSAPNLNTPELQALAEQVFKGGEVSYIIRAESDKGYFVESQAVGALFFVRFAKSLNLTTQQEARLVSDFKDLFIERLNLEPEVGTMATCKMCNQDIRYIGPYWEHTTGELQPRHPAWPK